MFSNFLILTWQNVAYNSITWPIGGALDKQANPRMTFLMKKIQ